MPESRKTEMSLTLTGIGKDFPIKKYLNRHVFIAGHQMWLPQTVETRKKLKLINYRIAERSFIFLLLYVIVLAKDTRHICGIFELLMKAAQGSSRQQRQHRLLQPQQQKSLRAKTKGCVWKLNRRRLRQQTDI